MGIEKLLALVSRAHTFLTIACSATLGATAAIGLLFFLAPDGLTPAPLPAHDSRFVGFGKAYVAQLGKAYAEAWEDGARLLDSGQSLATALATVRNTWEANRARLFEQIATPEFDKLIPESAKDADITPQSRAAMAAAWRGFAIGLGH